MSSDISLCTSTDCPRRKTCKRAMQAPSRYHQSYFNPYLYGEICKFFILYQSHNAEFSTGGPMEGEESSGSSEWIHWEA